MKFLIIQILMAISYSSFTQSYHLRSLSKSINFQQISFTQHKRPSELKSKTQFNAVPLDESNDIIVDGLKGLASNEGSNLFRKLFPDFTPTAASDYQNIAILVSGILYLLYEKRPRGDARMDLIDIRKSTVSNAGVGVFAKTFIPEGTVIGKYPGYLTSLDIALRRKKDKQSQERMRKYIWAVSEEMYLDPTNADGYVDLEQVYLFGLYKANTILARVNEPPPSQDVNIHIDIQGSDVNFTADRDITANEELFVDYGSRYDRGGYLDDPKDMTQQLALEESETERKKESQRIRRVVMDDDYDDMDTSSENDTSMIGGYLDKLTKADSKLQKSGILSPEDAAKDFVEFGPGMFRGSEDKDIIKSLIGKNQLKPFEDEKPVATTDRLNSYDDDMIEADLTGAFLGSEAVSSESASLFGDTPRRSTTTAPSVNNDKLIKSDSEMIPIVGNSKLTALSPEQAMAIQSRADTMSDEELKELVQRLKKTLNTVLTSEFSSKMKEKKSMGPNKGLKLPSTPPRDPEIRKKFDNELKEVESELEKMYQNPLSVWEELLKNPENYLDEETLKEIDKQIEKEGI